MENNKNDRSGNNINNNNESLFPSQSHVEMTQFNNQNSQRRNNLVRVKYLYSFKMQQ